MDLHEQIFTIQQLSLKLKIPKPTLRFWEKELDGILVPLRTHGGQRRYTPAHIPIIKEIKKFRKKGMSLVEVKRKLSNSNKTKEYNSNSSRLDLLADRIAEVVKAEVYSFLERQE